MSMNKPILTGIDKQAFLETLDADPEWAFEVLNRLLKRKESAETFREWLGINELARAIQDLAEAQQKTEQQVQALTQRIDVLAEAQRKTEQQVNVLTHQVSAISEVFGPTWEVEARESVAFLLPKSGVRLLTPLEGQEENEWDGVAEAEWEGRAVQVRMEAKVSAGAGRIISFANRVRSLATKTGSEIMPIFCGIRLYSGAREEAQKQKIVLVGLREIRNEIPPSIFTILPPNA